MTDLHRQILRSQMHLAGLKFVLRDLPRLHAPGRRWRTFNPVMANSHAPPDTMSYHEWGRTKILFGKTVRGLSYYQVAHGTEERFFYYRKWARTHLGNKSILGRDFVQYLAVKERYFGVDEDRQYLQMLQQQARAQATIPGTQQPREYVPEDDIWWTGGLA